MERGKLWRGAFAGNLRLLELNSAGLTAELADRRPASGVNSAAWILGHVTATRRRMVKLLGGAVPEDPAWEKHYARGGPGNPAHLPWEDLLAAFGATDAMLKEALLGVADWDRPTVNPAIGTEQALEQVLAFLYMHECYHLGQIGVVRKLHGLPGAL